MRNVRKVKAREAKLATVPTRFEPKFWEDADGRSVTVRRIRDTYAQLKADVGAGSAQKDLLVQRATFLALQLETMEVEAVETGLVDLGVYTQMTNALLGLLRNLGLERQAKQVGGLSDYLEERKR